VCSGIFSIQNLAVSYLTPEINAKPKNENAKEGRYNHQFDVVHWGNVEGHNKVLSSEMYLASPAVACALRTALPYATAPADLQRVPQSAGPHLGF